jgi:hypothetical protein
MKFRTLALSALVVVLLWGASAAFALNLTHPYFPIPLSWACGDVTSVTGYCVIPQSSTHYTATKTGSLSDYQVWSASGSGAWDDANKLMSMCIGNYESGGKFTYVLFDNYPNYQSESSDYRFDYGLMQVNSIHLPDFDPYYAINSEYWNMAEAYDIWDSSGWSAWSVYNAGYCNGNGAVWQYVGSSTCGYNPSYGTWGYWSATWIWVWYLGYAGDYGDGIGHMFC